MTGPTTHTIWEQRLTRALLVAVPLFLALFAWRFAQERLYADSGYYLARVVNEGGFRIEHGRWVLALAQLLPLIGTKLGLSLKTLVLLHSLNNVVWLLACVLLGLRVLRSPIAALALVCVHLIGLTHGLFCPVFELYYGADLLLLAWATLGATHLTTMLRLPLLTLCVALAATSHFLALLIGGGLLLLDLKNVRRRDLLLIVATTVAVTVVHVLSLSAYERSSMEFLVEVGRADALFSFQHLRELLGYLVTHYADVTLLAVITIAALVRFSSWRHAGMFFFVLVVLHGFTWLKLPGTIHDRYREQMNFATTAWVVMVFCLQVLPQLRWRAVGLSLLMVAALFRMVRAEWIAPWYAERTALIQAEVTMAQQAGLSKAIVVAPVYFGPPNHLIDLSWSTSVESLLLSASTGPERTVSLITTEDLQAPEVQADLDAFIFRRWDVLPTSWLNARYFQAPTGTYRPLPVVP